MLIEGRVARRNLSMVAVAVLVQAKGLGVVVAVGLRGVLAER